MRKFFIAIIIACFFVTPALSAGPSLSIVSSSPTVVVGQTFTIKVSANSNGIVANTLAADISFPSELVQAVSVTGPSVITIAITKNVIGDGIASIQGGIIPSLALENAPVGTITFKALKKGTATFSIVSSSDIYADDGQGTSLSPTYGNVTVAIGAATETKPDQTIPPKVLPPVVNAPVSDAIPASTNNLATICFPFLSQNWWQNNKDLVAIAAATALSVLGIYLVIKSLLVLRKKRKN